MEFATGALGTLLPKLGQLLKDEYNLQKGAKKDIEFLERELESMHATLHNVGEVPPEQVNQLVKIWARDVRELSYDMEDMVDTFLVRITGPEAPSKGSIKRFVKKLMGKITKAPTRHGITQELKDIKDRVKEVTERRDRYKVESVIVPTATMDDPRMAALYAKATDLVGVDETREELILRLTSGDDISMQQQRIISVFGFGGLGKTTLAKAVYDKLKAQFDCAAFVSVSRSPDKKKVLNDILYELDRGQIHSNMLNERHLIDLIREFLKNKRYLIVIDDIWEPQSWETIKMALLENNWGSRVITTTRILDVAEAAGEIYKLQPLSYSNSKELLYLRIFGGEGKPLDDQLDVVSEKFLKKCDGIPLAIITMASLLAGKPREIWSELYTAVGFGHKENMQVENTKKILSFSYNDMPSHLRTCLLYISAFPEDKVIRKDALILMWIAEGFIHTEQGNGLFELGERYFNELINRCMIQAVESEFEGIIQGCRVHDMVLDLICSLSQEENFFTIFHNGEGKVPQNKNKVRRLAFQRSTAEQNTPLSDHMDVGHLRSYVACVCRIDQPVPLLSFKVLRVLAIEDCQFKNDCHLESLGNLIHLRYLSVRRTNVCKLPEHIGDLKFLQTLELDIPVLPASISRLAQLVCLSCSLTYEVSEVPHWIGSLTSLEQLRINIGITADDNKIRMFVKELGNLRELKVLEFIFWKSSPETTGKSAQRDLVESIGKLHKIQQLTVKNYLSTADADTETWDAAGFTLPRHLHRLSLSCVSFSRLPSCIEPSCLHHLSDVELLRASEQDLKLLGRLTELCYLKLYRRTMATITVTSSRNAGDVFFPKLRFLRVGRGMVQFVHNEGDSTFSFHIWDGEDPMPFGSSTSSRTHNSCCSLPSAAIMPNLEVLSTRFYVQALKDGNGEYINIGLEYLTSLRKAQLVILDKDSTTTEIEEAEVALRSAINANPNHPTLETKRKPPRRI